MINLLRVQNVILLNMYRILIKCKNSKYCYPAVGRITTGDLKIIPNARFYAIKPSLKVLNTDSLLASTSVDDRKTCCGFTEMYALMQTSVY